jgi:fermentation-respiration switch protein FrsA (DUF1100 family)
MLRMIVVLAAGVALAMALLWFGQRRMIYFPDQNVGSPASMGLARAEEVTFAAADGVQLRGWWVPTNAPRPSGLTVIVFNGNGGNRAYRAALAGSLSQLGVSVLLFDYRGYGGNPGTPTEEGLAQDARAAARFVKARRDVDPNRIVYFGESLGAAVAVRLATEQVPAGLILRSPFTSLGAVGKYHYPWLPVLALLRDRYASVDSIARVGCPLLVIAGSRDAIVPPQQSRALFEAANEPKKLVIIPAADHNDYDLLAGDRMLSEVMGFLGER